MQSAWYSVTKIFLTVYLFMVLFRSQHILGYIYIRVAMQYVYVQNPNLYFAIPGLFGAK